MAISPKDIISLTHARAKLTDLCEEVHARGREKIITKNGESCAALIDAHRLDYYHRMVKRLRRRLEQADDLREFIADDYLLLYLVRGERIMFLSIKHHRQLSFDLKRFWI